MSNKYIDDAIRQACSINDPAAAHVFLVLANRADADGACRPSHKVIAQDTGMSVATVKRKLGVLRHQGRRGDRLMRRREFITLLGSTAASWPLAASAQQPDKLPTMINDAQLLQKT